jgi:hypothetical protein
VNCNSANNKMLLLFPIRWFARLVKVEKIHENIINAAEYKSFVL